MRGLPLFNVLGRSERVGISTRVTRCSAMHHGQHIRKFSMTMACLTSYVTLCPERKRKVKFAYIIDKLHGPHESTPDN